MVKNCHDYMKVCQITRKTYLANHVNSASYLIMIRGFFSQNLRELSATFPRVIIQIKIAMSRDKLRILIKTRALIVGCPP